MNQNDTLDPDLELAPADGDADIVLANLSSECIPSSTKETATLLTFGSNHTASAEGCICCPDTCGEQWFQFIAPTTEDYAIFSNTGMFDAYGYLYDNFNCCLACNDDSGAGLNFCMFHKLTANQTYYVRIRSVNNGSGRFTLTVKPATHVTSISILPSVLYLKPGISGTDSIHSTTTEISTGYLFATLEPGNSDCRDVIWSSSNTSVATVDRSVGLVRAKNKEGRATITARSVDGNLQATAEVIVQATGIPVIVNAPGVSEINVMANSKENSTVLGKFANQTTVILMNQTPENENWYLVYGKMTNGTYTSGWCFGEYLANEVDYVYLANTNNWIIREGPGTNFFDLNKRFYSGTFAELLEKSSAKTSDGYTWHKIRYDGVVGYVADTINNDGTSQNYIFKTYLIALIGGQPPHAPTEISDDGVNFIKDYEGFVATAQDDGYGNLTIGYGHVISAEQNPGTITEEKALEWLDKDIGKAQTLVSNYSKNRKVIWNQQEFDAFVSLAFNAGTAVSDVMDKIIAGDDAYDAFSEISKANGSYSLGLYRRRMDEADIFVKGDYTREYRSLPVG